MVQFGGILLTILVDIDSTITNFGEVLLFVNNIKNKTKYSYTDITTYYWFDETFANPWAPTNSHHFWDGVQVHPQAVSTLEQWVKQRHKIYLVTASHFNNTLGYKIRKTLEPFNPEFINERNVIITQDKSAIMGDVMIDDCINNLINFGGVRICYAQPWNKNWGKDFRYNNWNDIDGVVQAYSVFPWDK